MSKDRPIPVAYDGSPVEKVLPAGTRLTRIHSDSFSATEFNPTLAPLDWGGGRFDATAEDVYSYLYAASDDETAVSEALLRSLPINPAGGQILPRKKVESRLISWITSTKDLQLVSLRSGQEIAAVAQTTWLITAPSQDYPVTRRWGHFVRRVVPWSQGFCWRSRREPAGDAFVFFADRSAEAAFKEDTAGNPLPPGDNRLDDGLGEIYLREILAGYRTTLFP